VKNTKKIKVGYLGPKGTFSEEAARLWKKDAIFVAFPSLKELIDAVAEKKVDEDVVPISNLFAGNVTQSFDAIIKNNGNIKICGELFLSICLNLIAVNKIPLNQITKVISKKEVFPQCDEWIKKNLPNAKLVEVDSTAKAVTELEKHDETTAAIGTSLSATIHNRKILASNIHDDKNNATRFIVLANKEHKQSTGNDKTSLLFTVSNKCGALVKALIIFSCLRINMTKIDSIPNKKRIDEYLFWVDLDGHRKTKKIKIALYLLKRATTFLKILGSYPKAKA